MGLMKLMVHYVCLESVVDKVETSIMQSKIRTGKMHSVQNMEPPHVFVAYAVCYVPRKVPKTDYRL